MDYKSELKNFDYDTLAFRNLLIGAEIEFYVFAFLDSKRTSISDVTKGDYPKARYPIKPEFKKKFSDFSLSLKTSLQNFLLIKNDDGDILHEEDGCGQFEINFSTTNNPIQLCKDIISVKNIIKFKAEDYGLEICFEAKPLAEQVGSGLHIHLSFYDWVHTNVFSNSKILLERAIHGILSKAEDDIFSFCSKAKSLKRYEGKFNSPTKLCWGYNNRTAAIRVPDSDALNKRLENRLPSADCEPHKVIYNTIICADQGIRGNLVSPNQIWGNAYLNKYKYKAILN